MAFLEDDGQFSIHVRPHGKTDGGNSESVRIPAAAAVEMARAILKEAGAL